MKVLFIEDVQGTAYAGDIKEVKSGFARNFLLPRKLAVLATSDQMNRVNGLRTAAARRREATETQMTSLGERLNDVTVVIEGRAGRNDRLYGSITNVTVAEELSRIVERDIDRRRVVMDPIRQLGSYEVPVKLYTGIEPKITVVVTAPGRPAPGAEAAVVETAQAAAEGELDAAPVMEDEGLPDDDTGEGTDPSDDAEGDRSEAEETDDPAS
jgi:large subunit ribosomal protein L9